MGQTSIVTTMFPPTRVKRTGCQCELLSKAKPPKGNVDKANCSISTHVEATSDTTFNGKDWYPQMAKLARWKRISLSLIPKKKGQSASTSTPSCKMESGLLDTGILGSSLDSPLTPHPQSAGIVGSDCWSAVANTSFILQQRSLNWWTSLGSRVFKTMWARKQIDIAPHSLEVSKPCGTRWITTSLNPKNAENSLRKLATSASSCAKSPKVWHCTVSPTGAIQKGIQCWRRLMIAMHCFSHVQWASFHSWRLLWSPWNQASKTVGETDTKCRRGPMGLGPWE